MGYRVHAAHRGDFAGPITDCSGVVLQARPPWRRMAVAANKSLAAIAGGNGRLIRVEFLHGRYGMNIGGLMTAPPYLGGQIIVRKIGQKNLITLHRWGLERQ